MDPCSCKVCQIDFNSPITLAEHLRGARHRKTIQAINSLKFIRLPGNESSVHVPAEFDYPRRSRLATYQCDICNIKMNSQIQLQQHLQSKKHEENVQRIREKEKQHSTRVTVDDTDTQNEIAKQFEMQTIQENFSPLTKTFERQLASNSSKTTVYENHFLSHEKNDFFKLECDILSKTVCSDSSRMTENSSEEIEYEHPVAETDNKNDNLSHAVCRISPINKTKISVAERSSTGSISDHAIESEENASMSSSKHNNILSPDDVTNMGKLSKLEDNSNIEIVDAGHNTELDNKELIFDLLVPEQKISSRTSILDLNIYNDNEDSIPDLSEHEKIDCTSPSSKNKNSESGTPITGTDSVHDLSLDSSACYSPSKYGLTTNNVNCIQKDLILCHANSKLGEESRKVDAVHRSKVCLSDGFNVDHLNNFRMFGEDHRSQGPIVNLKHQESMKDCVADDTKLGVSLKDKGKTSAVATFDIKKNSASKDAGKPSVGPAEGQKNTEKTDKKPKKNFVQMNAKAFVHHSPDYVKTSVAVYPKVVEAKKRWSGSTSTKSLIKARQQSDQGNGRPVPGQHRGDTGPHQEPQPQHGAQHAAELRGVCPRRFASHQAREQSDQGNGRPVPGQHRGDTGPYKEPQPQHGAQHAAERHRSLPSTVLFSPGPPTERPGKRPPSSRPASWRHRAP